VGDKGEKDVVDNLCVCVLVTTSVALPGTHNLLGDMYCTHVRPGGMEWFPEAANFIAVHKWSLFMLPSYSHSHNEGMRTRAA
jgi:hypothetical protein